MVKKTSKVTTKSNLERRKAEQWSKRVQAQTGRPVGPAVSESRQDMVARVATEDVPLNGTSSAGAGTVVTSPSSRVATTRTTAAGRPRTAAPVAPAAGAARRPVAGGTRPRAGRATVDMMSLDEEMSYVRSDVRMLILLTVICFLVIIVLSFVIR